MRYSKSMIEAVKQVGLYEMMDYAIVDGDNKIIGLYKGSMAKKQAQMNLKGAEKQVQIKKPVKVIPVSNKKKGDTVIGIGEQPLTDKDREAIDEGRYIVHSKKQGKKPVGMMTIKTTIPNAKNERDAIKQAIAMSKPSGGGLKGDEITAKDIVKVVKEELNEDDHVLSEKELFSATPLPWATGRSWLQGIETGMSGLGRYLSEESEASRSGGGIQSQGIIRSGRFRNAKYISEILKCVYDIKSDFLWINQNKAGWDYSNLTLPKTKYFKKARKNGLNPFYIKLMKL